MKISKITSSIPEKKERKSFRKVEKFRRMTTFREFQKKRWIVSMNAMRTFETSFLMSFESPLDHFLRPKTHKNKEMADKP